jgi:hypothetical protein
LKSKIVVVDIVNACSSKRCEGAWLGDVFVENITSEINIKKFGFERDVSFSQHASY